MRIYSDTLTSDDFFKATRNSNCYVSEVTPMKDTKVRERGWTVYLLDHDSGRSASWNQTGEWIAKLYMIDPHARINLWDGADMFSKGARYRGGPHKGKTFLSVCLTNSA